MLAFIKVNRLHVLIGGHKWGFMPHSRLNTACFKYMFGKNYLAHSSFYFLICLVFIPDNLSLKIYMGGTF